MPIDHVFSEWSRVWWKRGWAAAVLVLSVGCGPRYDTAFVATRIDSSQEITDRIAGEQTRLELPGFRVIVWLKRFERHGNMEGSLTWFGNESDTICLDVESIRLDVTGHDKEGNHREYIVHVTRRLGLESKRVRKHSECADLLMFDFDLSPPPGCPRFDPSVLDVYYKLRYSDGSFENKHFRLHLKPKKVKAISPFAV